MRHPIDELREMLLAITRSLVDHPGDVQIESVSDGETITFIVRTHPTDTGKLIGLNGRTVRALRVLLNANGVRLNLRLILNISSADESRV